MHASAVTNQVRLQAQAAPVRVMAGVLQEVLTRPLTADIVASTDGEVEDWASGARAVVDNRDVERRLRAAYETVLLLLTYDSPRTIRAWFTGMAPELGDTAPAEAIRSGKFEDVLTAATAFTVNG